LPNRLRRMIDSYHLVIERLTSIDVPVVAAVLAAADRVCSTLLTLSLRPMTRGLRWVKARSV